MDINSLKNSRKSYKAFSLLILGHATSGHRSGKKNEKKKKKKKKKRKKADCYDLSCDVDTNVSPCKL